MRSGSTESRRPESVRRRIAGVILGTLGLWIWRGAGKAGTLIGAKAERLESDAGEAIGKRDAHQVFTLGEPIFSEAETIIKSPVPESIDHGPRSVPRLVSSAGDRCMQARLWPAALGDAQETPSCDSAWPGPPVMKEKA